MNKQGLGKIDWCDYSWNPISGCLHGCPYCYMQRMKKRFKNIMTPAFHSSRLRHPAKVKKPSLIFTGSSGDMWGDFIQTEWIDNVLDACSTFAPWHTYQFLTKNPKRYGEFYCIENGWYGTTDDGTKRTKNNIRDLVYYAQAGMVGRFVSFEPLLAPVEPDLFGIQWVIIGADSTRGAKKPPKEWADSIIRLARKRNLPVFVKDNYGYPKRLKEMPTQEGPVPEKRIEQERSQLKLW